ncbi:MAG: DUF2905 domain-containing protein [Anaerolineae bacterium]|nr:DUF2905 domain-containing protein [Anaerolineae bacterium]
MESIGKVIFGIGIILVLLGLGLWFLGDKLSWFGHLPGDIRVERENFHFYAPITSMVILSIVLSLVLSLIARLFK